MFIYLCGIYMERNNLERFGSRIFLRIRQLVRRSFTQATFRTGSGSSRRGSSRS